MKATIIQDQNTKEVIMYYIDNVRVSKITYHEKIDLRLKSKVGCYNSSFTTRTKIGNFKHVSYYSI